jgi:outer membrane immunogenic protein
MKKCFLASAAAIALLSVPAQAADMPIKAPPRAAAITTSWAGFYVGGHVGYGIANTAVSATDIGLTDRFIGFGGKGYVAGGLAGYNVMLAPRWVAGIEVDGSWQDIETKASFFSGEFLKMSMDWSASVRGRIGLLMTPTSMLFVTGGWSWSELKFTSSLPGESVTRSMNGAQVGFGVETMVTDNWIFRTEYLQSFYNDVDFGSDFISQDILKFSPWVGVIRSALIYKAGPTTPTAWPDRPPQPVWAGFYIGGMVGPWLTNAKLSAPVDGTSLDRVGVTSVCPSALVGYNLMVAPRWIIGVEGEIAPNISTSDIEVEWTGAARGRIGYLITPGVLTYASAGWGTSTIKSITQGGTTISVPRFNAIGIGSGVEAAVTDRWRLRADYTYFFSDSVDVAVPGIGTPITLKATGHTARLGAMYALGGP